MISPPPPLTIRLETPNHVVRTVEQSDATENWCRWLLDADTARQLNASPRQMTMAELRTYIAHFDRVTGHLLGIFERTGGPIVGIRVVYVDYTRREFLDNVLVGEHGARGKAAFTESTAAIQHFFFEELDLVAGRCSVLTSNTKMIELLNRRGWELVGVEPKASNAGGAPVELRHFRLMRDAWRHRENANRA
jgi:RimJ/RimL family protein N-acetyltransferase